MFRSCDEHYVELPPLAIRTPDVPAHERTQRMALLYRLGKLSARNWEVEGYRRKVHVAMPRMKPCEVAIWQTWLPDKRPGDQFTSLWKNYDNIPLQALIRYETVRNLMAFEKLELWCSCWRVRGVYEKPDVLLVGCRSETAHLPPNDRYLLARWNRDATQRPTPIELIKRELRLCYESGNDDRSRRTMQAIDEHDRRLAA